MRDEDVHDRLKIVNNIVEFFPVSYYYVHLNLNHLALMQINC